MEKMKSAKILFVCGICQKESHKIIKTSEEVIKRLKGFLFLTKKQSSFAMIA
jgi:hypothetical protein